MLGFLPIEKLDKNFLFALTVHKSYSGSQRLFRHLITLLTHLKGGGTWRAVVLPESDRQGSGDKAVASNCYCTC